MGRYSFCRDIDFNSDVRIMSLSGKFKEFIFELEFHFILFGVG